MKVILLCTSIALITSCASNITTPNAKKQVKDMQQTCTEATSEMKKRQRAEPLYNRLGKRKKITIFVDKLLVAHKENKQIGPMFRDVSSEPFRTHVTEFIAVGSGGKGKYTGKSMHKAHEDLYITSEDFIAVRNDVTTVMNNMNYGKNEQQEVVCALVSFVPVVVKDRGIYSE